MHIPIEPLDRIVAGQCHSDACAQGRMRCPTPDACWREDHDGFVSATAAWFWRLYAAAVIVVIATGVAWLL